MANKKSWYDMKAAANDTVEIFIYDEIGYWGLRAKDFARTLKDFGKISNIHLHINSPGGSVWDGTAIYNLLKAHPAYVTAFIDGLAASMGSVVPMAADKIIMPENSLMMIHNPSTGAGGEAKELRKAADLLDKVKKAMASIYMARSGKSEDEINAIMDEETWYTGAEAVEAGFADEVAEAVDLAACFEDVNFNTEIFRGYNKTPFDLAACINSQSQRVEIDTPSNNDNNEQLIADLVDLLKVKLQDKNLIIKSSALADIINQEEVSAMPGTKKTDTPDAPDAGGDKDIDVEAIRKEAAANALKAEKSRRTEVKAVFEPFGDAHNELMASCINDLTIDADEASKQLLAALGEGSKPSAGGFDTVTTRHADGGKQLEDINAALEHRLGVVDKDADPKAVKKAIANNGMMGYTLLELARAVLIRHNAPMQAMDKMAVIGAAFTHSSGDFGNALGNIANKSMLRGYEEEETTFDKWVNFGVLTDFKIATRVGMDSFPSLRNVPAGAEFKYATLGDSKEQTWLATYGELFGINRHAIINDDLDFFTRLPAKMGAAWPRTVNKLVYAVLASSDLMADGVQLFHASHNNIGASSAIDTDSITADKLTMRLQKDGTGNRVGSRAVTMLAPAALEGRGKKYLNNQFDPDEAIPGVDNPNQNTLTLVTDPEMDDVSAAIWYLVAGPNTDHIEVSYLDGNAAPVLEQMNGWTIDGTEFKVRGDAGCKPMGYRGLTKNAGV